MLTFREAERLAAFAKQHDWCEGAFVTVRANSELEPGRYAVAVRVDDPQGHCEPDEKDPSGGLIVFHSARTLRTWAGY